MNQSTNPIQKLSKDVKLKGLFFVDKTKIIQLDTFDFFSVHSSSKLTRKTTYIQHILTKMFGN